MPISPWLTRCKIFGKALIPDFSAPKGFPPWQRSKPPSSRAQTLHQGPFVTEPFYDFRHEENARKMRAAIAKVRGQLGREYDLIIGGKRIKTTDKIKSLNPSQPSQIVGIHQKANKDHVEPAMKAALVSLRILEPHHRRRTRRPAVPG